MTQNQIRYDEHKETKRHDRAMERLQSVANQIAAWNASIAQTNAETNRTNAETNRINAQTNLMGTMGDIRNRSAQLLETQRHNEVVEAQTQWYNEASVANDTTRTNWNSAGQFLSSAASLAKVGLTIAQLLA